MSRGVIHHFGVNLMKCLLLMSTSLKFMQIDMVDRVIVMGNDILRVRYISCFDEKLPVHVI